VSERSTRLFFGAEDTSQHSSLTLGTLIQRRRRLSVNWHEVAEAHDAPLFNFSFAEEPTYMDRIVGMWPTILLFVDVRRCRRQDGS
jgi:hypothetical protein